MNFLDRIYFDNTLRSYLVVVLIILFVLVVKRYLSQYLVSLIYKLARRFWKTLDKQSFLALVVEPFKWFLAIVIAVFAIDKLNFPSDLNYEIYGHSTKDIFSRIGPGVIIVSFIWLVLRLIDFIAIVLEGKASVSTDARENQLIVFFRDFLKVIVGICGLLLIIKACFHQPVGSVLTGLSLVGAALALAAKESLENLIASFIIFFDKPFFTGDTIKVNNITGTVERIGLRSTRIRTADKTLVTVPNKQMVDSAVDNWSLRTERRAEIKLELSAGTTAATLQQLLTEIKTLLVKQSSISSSTVFVKELSRNASLISIEFFTAPFTLNEFFELKENVNLSIKKILETKHVEFAGESSSIIIRSENNTEG